MADDTELQDETSSPTQMDDETRVAKAQDLYKRIADALPRLQQEALETKDYSKIDAAHDQLKRLDGVAVDYLQKRGVAPPDEVHISPSEMKETATGEVPPPPAALTPPSPVPRPPAALTPTQPTIVINNHPPQQAERPPVASVDTYRQGLPKPMPQPPVATEEIQEAPKSEILAPQEAPQSTTPNYGPLAHEGDVPNDEFWRYVDHLKEQQKLDQAEEAAPKMAKPEETAPALLTRKAPPNEVDVAVPRRGNAAAREAIVNSPINPADLSPEERDKLSQRATAIQSAVDYAHELGRSKEGSALGDAFWASFLALPAKNREDVSNALKNSNTFNDVVAAVRKYPELLEDEKLKGYIDQGFSPGEKAFFHLSTAVKNAANQANMTNDVGTPVESGLFTTLPFLEAMKSSTPGYQSSTPLRTDARNQVDSIVDKHSTNAVKNVTNAGARSPIDTAVEKKESLPEVNDLLMLAKHFPDDPEVLKALREFKDLPNGGYDLGRPTSLLESQYMPSVADTREDLLRRQIKQGQITPEEAVKRMGLSGDAAEKFKQSLTLPAAAPSAAPSGTTPTTPSVTPSAPSAPVPEGLHSYEGGAQTQPGLVAPPVATVTPVVNPDTGTQLHNPFERFLDSKGDLDTSKMMADIQKSLPPIDYQEFQRRVAKELGSRPKPSVWTIVGSFFAGLSGNPAALRIANQWHDEAMKWDEAKNRIGQEMNTKADTNMNVATQLLGQMMRGYTSQLGLQTGIAKFNVGQENQTQRLAFSQGQQNARQTASIAAQNARQTASIAAQNMRADASNEERRKIAEEGITSREQLALMNQEWKEAVLQLVQNPRIAVQQKRTDLMQYGIAAGLVGKLLEGVSTAGGAAVLQGLK